MHRLQTHCDQHTQATQSTKVRIFGRFDTLSGHIVNTNHSAPESDWRCHTCSVELCSTTHTHIHTNTWKGPKASLFNILLLFVPPLAEAVEDQAKHQDPGQDAPDDARRGAHIHGCYREQGKKGRNRVGGGGKQTKTLICLPQKCTSSAKHGPFLPHVLKRFWLVEHSRGRTVKVKLELASRILLVAVQT